MLLPHHLYKNTRLAARRFTSAAWRSSAATVSTPPPRRHFSSEPRESMAFDVLIVGGGPAGLAASIRLKQLCVERGQDLSVCVVEKGRCVGAVDYMLAGASCSCTYLATIEPVSHTKHPSRFLSLLFFQ